MTLGGLATSLDADVRRFPFEFSVGISSRLTATVTVPIVVTRVNAAVALDSTTGNAGWNQYAPEAGNPTAVTQVNTLLASLQAAADQLDAAIAGGQHGCPSSTQCDAARSLVTRARALRANVASLVTSPGGILPPAAPISTSPAGTAIAAAISSTIAQFATFGVAATGSLPLPAGRMSAESVQDILTSGSFGYNAAPFEYRKVSAFGDVEAGVRFGLVQTEATRLLIRTPRTTLLT
jgi:hypothetical protein